MASGRRKIRRGEEEVDKVRKRRLGERRKNEGVLKKKKGSLTRK